MKLLERVLILMSFIGYYLAVWRRPADYSVIFISIAALALLYIAAMPFLLHRSAMASAELTEQSAFRRQYLLPGYLFGILSAYCAFSLTYHSLRRMDSLALAENCGIFLALFAAFAAFRLRKRKEVFYKKMLLRAGVLAVLIVLSILVLPMQHT